jgi:hypothetical protein
MKLRHCHRMKLEGCRVEELSSGMLRRVTPVGTNVSGKRSASIIRVTRIGELGTALAITSNYLRSLRWLLVTPRGSCKNRRFGGKCRLHHQGDKNRRARNNANSN